MQSVLLVVHLLVVLALVGVVLLQRSEGGGLGIGGGGGGGGVQGFLTGRGQANALTRATAILAAAFFVLSIALSVMAGQNRQQRSIIDGATRPAAGQQTPATPQAPSGGNLLDQLRQIDGQSAPGGAQPPAPAGAQPPRPAAPAQ
jgi:preprotein translocase subunit SecG